MDSPGLTYACERGFKIISTNGNIKIYIYGYIKILLSDIIATLIAMALSLYI